MNQAISKVVSQAKEFMEANAIDGWLLYDYRGMNPIFWDTVGEIPNVTRPCWLWIPTNTSPKLIVSYVDQNRFEHLGIETNFWVSRDQMIGELQAALSSVSRVAMEYSPWAPYREHQKSTEEPWNSSAVWELMWSLRQI